jgi:hypothetical protein
MNKAIQQFQINLQSARQLGVIYLAFCDKVTGAITLEELLRAELVLAVSALDCYIHDVVRIGMERAFNAPSGEPNAFLSFEVTFGFVKELLGAISDAERNSLVDREIRRAHGFKTFQAADKISQALSLIGVTAIWEKVGAEIGLNSKDARTKLNVIIDRRNRIAHEGDIDPSSGIGIKFAIDFPAVKEAVDFLDVLAQTIQKVVITEVKF